MGSEIVVTIRSRDTTDDGSSVVVVSPPESETGQKGKVSTESKNDSGSDSDSDSDSEDDKDEKTKEKVMVGSLAETKDLYAKYDENGDRSWTDKRPSDLEEAAENEETQKYAVIIRKKKPRFADSTKPLEIDSLIVQSPYIKRALSKVFKDYPGIITDLSRLTFHAPFECFVHQWALFEAAKDDPENDEITREHMALLYKIMRDELGDTITLRADYFKNRAVPFSHVWTLFPPGCTVWGHKNGKPVGLKFKYGSYVKTQCGQVYLLQCQMLEWDGSLMGWSDHDQRIPEYLGTMSFSTLPCYPLEYHPQAAIAREMLLERGRRWESLAGYHYKAYKGTAIWHIDSRRSRKENVQSRVVIDGDNWEKNNQDNVVYLEALNSERGYLPDDSEDDEADGEEQSRRPLTEDLLLFASPMVRGYALKNKRWMEFFVDDVAEISFNEQAFESLVLPADQKDLILAFAQSQVKYKDAFDDIISGKGKGIIMLLSGGPGIGKTLTAESVAEEMRVPLYIMSAGDLGADASDIDNNLQEILEMVANWNAVLLLDECDVFLEERSAHDIERNRIVSIFLRTLEYYEGILFLTTNRVKNMDPAFQSRIHMSLEYPPLDATSRETVWRGFLGRTFTLDATTGGSAESTHDVTEDEIKALAGLELNGRQIKNVLKTANLLACNKQEKLSLKHLRTVLKVEGHFL